MERTNTKSNKPKRKYTKNPNNIPPKQKSKYQKVEEVQKLIDNYFKQCKKDKEPYTVIGLALALDLNSRQALLNYENEEKHKDLEPAERKAIVDAIKKAKMKIEKFLEINLFEGRQVAGTIFNLKNNYNYIDRTDINHGGNIIFEIDGLEKF